MFSRKDAKPAKDLRILFAGFAPLREKIAGGMS